MNVISPIPLPSIVAIDNKQDELNTIVQGLNGAGISAVSYLYSIEEGLTLPDEWSGELLRVLFLDLNLGDIEDQTNHKDIASKIIEVIEKLKPSGPYRIVFWTKHPDLVDSVMEIVSKRLDSAVPLPADFTNIDKKEIKLGTKLHAEIQKSFSEDLVLSCLEGWEGLIRKAAGDVLHDLYSLTRVPRVGADDNPDDEPDDGRGYYSDDMGLLLRHLAVSAWGDRNAKENIAPAVTTALNPLLQDRIDFIKKDDNYVQLWTKGIDINVDGKLPERISRAQLRTKYLIDIHHFDEKCRGIWLDFNRFQNEESEKQWERVYGLRYDICREEFLNTARKDAVVLLTGADFSSFKLGLLEISAACDYAQKKSDVTRYILAARVSNGARTCSSFGKGKCKHDAIYRIENLEISGTTYDLLVNFNYIISRPTECSYLRETTSAAFRLRSQLLDMLLTKCAVHASRLGVIEI